MTDSDYPIRATTRPFPHPRSSSRPSAPSCPPPPPPIPGGMLQLFTPTRIIRVSLKTLLGSTHALTHTTAEIKRADPARPDTRENVRVCVCMCVCACLCVCARVCVCGQGSAAAAHPAGPRACSRRGPAAPPLNRRDLRAGVRHAPTRRCGSRGIRVMTRMASPAPAPPRSPQPHPGLFGRG